MDPNTGVFAWTPSLAQLGTYPVTVRVTDSGSPALSAFQTISITVTAPANTAPTLGTLVNRTITATSNLTFTATASDADLPGQTLTFSLDAGAPVGAAINPVSGLFSWAPTLAQLGAWPVTVRVTDNGSPALSAFQTISITVTAPVNTAPTLGTLVNQTVTATSNLTFAATASDADLPGQTLTFSLDAGAPVGAAINPVSGLFSWAPTLAQLGTYPVTVRVTDSGSPALSAFQAIEITVTGPANTAPTLATLVNRSVVATSNLTFTVTASDADLPAQTLTFSLDTNAPGRTSINPSNGVFSWTPNRGQVGTHAISVLVTDNGSPSLSATQTVSITVNPVGAPSITGPLTDQAAFQSAPVTFSVIATGSSALSYRWQFNGHDLVGATGSSLTLANPQVADAGAYTVIVTNRYGAASSSCRLAIHPPPVISSQPASQAAQVGSPVTFVVRAEGTGLTYQWRFNGNVISGAAGSSYTLPSAREDDSGFYSVVVTNGAGGVASANAQLLVVPPPDPSNAPTIALLKDGQGAFTLSFASRAGYNYFVQTNADFGTTNWGTILTVPASFDSGIISLPQSTAQAPRLFYRVVIRSD